MSTTQSGKARRVCSFVTFTCTSGKNFIKITSVGMSAAKSNETRYTAAKQNMHTNGLVHHMLTLLQKQTDKSLRVYSDYL